MVDDRLALVFERVHASEADQEGLESLLTQLLALTRRLHAEPDLGAALDADPVTAGQAIDTLWGRRTGAQDAHPPSQVHPVEGFAPPLVLAA